LKYSKSLDNQLSKVRELSAQEKLINDIKEQGLKFSPQQLAQATELAKKIDDRVRQEQEIKDLLEQQTAERARQKTQEQFEFDVKMTDATLGMGPKQAEEFKRSAKVGFTFDQAKGDAELKYEQHLQPSPNNQSWDIFYLLLVVAIQYSPEFVALHIPHTRRIFTCVAFSRPRKVQHIHIGCFKHYISTFYLTSNNGHNIRCTTG